MCMCVCVHTLYTHTHIHTGKRKRWQRIRQLLAARERGDDGAHGRALVGFSMFLNLRQTLHACEYYAYYTYIQHA